MKNTIKFLFIILITLTINCSSGFWIEQDNNAATGSDLTSAGMLPTKNYIYTIEKGHEQKIGFKTIIYGDPGQQVISSVIYRKVGENIWNSFGILPAKDYNGQATKPNGIKNQFINNYGWNCTMGNFVRNPPNDCNSFWTDGENRGMPAYVYNPIYFPNVSLPVGVYEYSTRAYSITKGKYSDWSLVSRFSILDHKPSPYPNIINRIYPSQKVVALTFDDGPGGVSTKTVCEILNKYHSQATFFYVGSYVTEDYGDAAEALKCGEIANHSWSHNSLTSGNLSFAAINNEIKRTQDLYSSQGYPLTYWFRPMGGNYNQGVLDAAKLNGLSIVNWNVKSFDYLFDANDRPTYSSEKIKNDILNKVQPGSIILLHSVYVPNTLDALPGILIGLKNKGYTVTSVSGLMSYY